MKRRPIHREPEQVKDDLPVCSGEFGEYLQTDASEQIDCDDGLPIIVVDPFFWWLVDDAGELLVDEDGEPLVALA